MSLRLRQTVAGRPSVKSRHGVATITVGGAALIVYASASNIVLLDHELELIHTLPFWSTLPYRSASSSKQEVEGVVTNQQDKLIIAWSGTHAVIWQWRTQRDIGNWTTHSTLVLSAPITCIDYKGGILICGTSTGLELWRHDPKSSVVVWDRVWERQMPAPDTVIISPASGHIACFAKSERCVRVFTISSKGDLSGMPQEMRHPREIDWIGWRRPRSLTSGDAHLYTITTNSVMRIYAPVLDDPAWFQLHSTLDGRAFLPKPIQSTSGRGMKGKVLEVDPKGMIWPLEADFVREAIKVALEQDEQVKEPSAEIRRMMEALSAEETDVVMWLGEDGSLALRSIVNMDRKPPTLLKTLPLARLTIPFPGEQSKLSPRLLHIPNSPTILAITSPTPQHPFIRPIQLSLPLLLSGDPIGCVSLRSITSDESTQVQLSSPISSFVRTPNGRGLLALTESGEVGAWAKRQRGKPVKGVKQLKTLLGRGSWLEDDKPDLSAIYAKGRAIVTFTSGSGGKKPGIWLRHLDPGDSKPTTPIPIPDCELAQGETVKMLMAVSDVDDGHSGEGRKTQQAYIMAASDSGTAWVWRVVTRRLASDGINDTQQTAAEESDKADVPDIRLLSRYQLPIDDTVSAVGSISKPGNHRLILPVDPMGWHQSVVDWNTNVPLQDIILTVSDSGVLEFWRPTFHKGSAAALSNNANATSFGLNRHTHEEAWTRTGVVHTGKKGILMARCSSRKKTVLVSSGKEGEQEMTIWNSKVSEFSTGLELTKIYGKDDIIQDLDWTTTSDLQSVLAVGFAHKVELVCEQRMGYADDTPGWATFITIDLLRYTSVPIDDSIWLAGGSLAVGCGNQIYLFSRFLDRESPVPTPRSSVRNVSIQQEEPEDVFELIAHQNGPLLDYHPTVLAQCLLWNKIDLVKEILVNLRQSMKTAEEEGWKRVKYNRMDPMGFTKRAEAVKKASKSGSKQSFLFDTAPDISAEDDNNADFTESAVSDLVDRLSPEHESGVEIPLTFAERSMLATIARATLEVEAQRRALDICGLRYLISLRMFVNSNRRSPLSGTATPSSFPSSSIPQQRLSFRNIVWATHSESQDVLLKAAEEGCESGKMIWTDAKRLGVFLWLKSAETAKAQLEILARNRFMMDESRDPTCCSLIFFALGKKKVVHGLWRQAPGHKEQNLMLKFLANDFELERWKTAAAKNAYALLSKQRYEYAAAFFMLSGSPKDAITIILRQLDDWQLAFALARVVENGTDGPLVKWILSDTVVPLAFAGGHRWLATWAFWALGRRDLAVRVLIAPMGDVAADWSSESMPVGNPENDDPSLLLLFQYLKSKSLQTAKGTSEIKGKTEFDFVLHNARVFCRMGCHPLALDLLRSWSFDRPFFPAPKARSKPLTSLPLPSPSPVRPTLESISPSFTRTRRPSFMLSAHGRRESMVMDMDVLAESEAPTRVATPSEPLKGVFEDGGKKNDHVDEGDNGKQKEAVVEPEKPKKMGNLMKELKQDVQQGAMEFNMDSFF